MLAVSHDVSPPPRGSRPLFSSTVRSSTDKLSVCCKMRENSFVGGFVFFGTREKSEGLTHIHKTRLAFFSALSCGSEVDNRGEHMSKHGIQKLVQAFIQSRLDDCNGLFTGRSPAAIRQLSDDPECCCQRCNKDHKHSVLTSLLWLPQHSNHSTLAPHRNHFRIIVFVNKSLNGSGPTPIRCCDPVGAVCFGLTFTSCS